MSFLMRFQMYSVWVYLLRFWYARSRANKVMLLVGPFMVLAFEWLIAAAVEVTFRPSTELSFLQYLYSGVEQQNPYTLLRTTYVTLLVILSLFAYFPLLGGDFGERRYYDPSADVPPWSPIVGAVQAFILFLVIGPGELLKAAEITFKLLLYLL